MQNFVRSATASTKRFWHLKPSARLDAKGSPAKDGTEDAQAWPHECCCAKEALAPAEAALGAGEDEAEGEGEAGQAVVRNRNLAVPQGFFFVPLRPIRLKTKEPAVKY